MTGCEDKNLALDRRSFLGVLGTGAFAVLSSGIAGLQAKAEAAGNPHGREIGPIPGPQRAIESLCIREEAASDEAQNSFTSHPVNGDENLYPNKIGNYSKGLLHDLNGEVNLNSYATYMHALTTGKPSDFEAIILGGNVKLVNPQAGLAFDLEGADSQKLSSPPAPALASAQRAGEAVENYWMAVLRDVPFSQYATNALAQAAIVEINNLSDFRGPQDPVTGKVSADTLFRGFTPGDLVGPYISQFLLQPFAFGCILINQTMQTYVPGIDYMTDFTSWLSVQNGQGPFAKNSLDPTHRYIRNGRDLSAYVHVDAPFEGGFNASLILNGLNAPMNQGNPYIKSKTQSGFGTFGVPYIQSLLAEVHLRAIKAAWYQKWFVHRALRPEEYGGLVHKTLSGIKNYPLHTDILNSAAVHQCFGQNGSYLLPHAFPEGCPQHPSYTQGHATCAGALATLLKAFFNESFIIPKPVVASDDGLSLVPYTGADAAQITLGGEADKLAANLGIGRNHAAVHWRSDYQASLFLGEAVAISILSDQRATYNEEFAGFTFTKFDGTTMTI